MEIIKLGIYGIELYRENSVWRIVSDMHEKDTPENAEFNAAVDGLESLILAHVSNEMDVESPAYIAGVEDAYTAISAQFS